MKLERSKSLVVATVILQFAFSLFLAFVILYSIIYLVSEAIN